MANSLLTTVLPALGIKCTFIFGQDKYDWTESHVWMGQPTFAGAAAAALQLGQARVALLGKGGFLNAIRLTDFPGNRLSYDVPLGGYGAALSPNWPADPSGLLYSGARAYQALLLRVTSSAGLRTSIYVGGCPAALAHASAFNTTGINWAATPNFGNRFLAFKSALGNGLWGFASRTGTVYQAGSAPVTSVSAPGTVGITVPVQIPPPASGPRRIIVTGYRRINTRLPPLNGSWTIALELPPTPPAVTGWTYFLFGSGNVPVNNYLSNGQIGQLTPVVVAYDSITPREFTSRKRGASIGAPRGRSRTRS